MRHQVLRPVFTKLGTVVVPQTPRVKVWIWAFLKNIGDLTLVKVRQVSSTLKYEFILNFLRGIQWWNSHPWIWTSLWRSMNIQCSSMGVWEMSTSSEANSHAIALNLPWPPQIKLVRIQVWDFNHWFPRKNWVGIQVIMRKNAGVPWLMLSLRCSFH